MSKMLLEVATGLVAGVLSGTFGIGGGMVTTPAIRLLLGYPELIAVGTPLLIIIPTAISGAISYARSGLADVRSGVVVGIWGSAAAILGAWLSALAGGRVVLLVTAALIAYMAVDMLRRSLRKGEPPQAPFHESHPHRGIAVAVLGIATGLYSGFLGLGGGFVLVPLLTRWFGFPIKRAIGTSLVAIGVLAIPGSITHWYLGHIDVRLALLLMIGVIPGALLGARLTAKAGDRAVQVAFAVFLAAVGVVLGLSELGVI